MALTSHLSWREKEIYAIFITQIGQRLYSCKTLARGVVSPHLCSLIRPLKLSKVQCPTSLLNKVVTNLDNGMIWRCFEHLLIVLKVLTCSMLYSAKLALYSGYWNRGKVINIYTDQKLGRSMVIIPVEWESSPQLSCFGTGRSLASGSHECSGREFWGGK